MKVIALVPAAGASRRFGPGANKPFHMLLDKPLIVWALTALEASERISEVIPVLKDTDMRQAADVFRSYGLSKIKRMAKGGPERQDSVYNALMLIGDEADAVLIHDGARPLLEKTLVEETLKGLEGYDGAIAAVLPRDTIKEAGENNALRTLRREDLWSVQTPQVFRYRAIMDAYQKAMQEGFYSTDDSALLERQGGRVRVVEGSYKNIKITTPEDIDIAEMFLRKGVKDSRGQGAK